MFSLAIGCMVLLAGEIFLLSLIFLYRSQGRIAFAPVVLLTWTGLSLLTFLLLEMLSAFHLLASVPLYAGWGLAAGGMSIVLFRMRGKAGQDWQILKSWLRETARGANWADAILLLILLAAFGVLGFVAFIYPPNNYDSMTYHLPRVMHWAQNGSLDPYATANERQVQFQPLAEYLLLNLYLLSGTDRLFNFVQLASFGVCLAGIWTVTDFLCHGNRKVSWVGLFLGMTLPSALLQAVTTQNDLVASAFTFSFIGCAGFLIKRGGWFWSAAVGLALGLALLTKSSTLIILLPFIFIIAFELLRRYKFKALVWGAGIGLLSASIYTPYSIRTLQVYGQVGGPTQNYRNAAVGLDTIVANTLKNFALNFRPDKNSPSDDLIRGIQNQLEKAHAWTGLSAKDPRLNWEYQAYNPFQMEKGYNEDILANPVHAGLIAIAALILVVRAFWVRDRIALYTLMGLASYVLFAAVFRWQPWGNRLLIPTLLILCPAVAALVFRRIPLLLAGFVLVILLVEGGNAVRESNFRPLSPPLYRDQSQIQLVFATSEHLRKPYEGMMQAIKETSCKRIGLVIGSDTQEYPLWRLMKRDGIEGTINHVEVHNPTGMFEGQNSDLCALIVEKKRWQSPDAEGWHLTSFENFDLYLKK